MGQNPAAEGGRKSLKKDPPPLKTGSGLLRGGLLKFSSCLRELRIVMNTPSRFQSALTPPTVTIPDDSAFLKFNKEISLTRLVWAVDSLEMVVGTQENELAGVEYR